MNSSFSILDCDQVLEELPAVIYGEATTEIVAGVEHHVQRCPSCQVEYDAARSAMRSLDAWSEPLQPTAGRAPPLNRWRRVAVSAAAAGLVFMALVGVGTEVDIGSGQVRVTFGEQTPGAAESDEQRMRQFVEAEVGERLNDVLDILATDLGSMERRFEQGRVLLANAVDRRMGRNVQANDATIRVIIERQELEAELTRRALDDIATWIVANRHGTQDSLNENERNTDGT
jgi:hypothetical protein